MGKTIQEIALVASEWWADKVCAPTMGNFNNGDDSFTGFMCMVMAGSLAKPVEDDVRSKFLQKMVDKIVARAEAYKTEDMEEEEYDWSISFGCDYGPDYFFHDIIEETGVSSHNFPWKTNMWITKDHVSVSAGYGAKPKILYANKAYYLKKIKQTEDYIESYRNGEMLRYMPDGPDKEQQVQERITELQVEIEEYKKCLEEAEE